jgi:signal transduction histidine kinase
MSRDFSSRQARILHISDDAGARSRTRRCLETNGYAVLDAVDAASGLRQARALPDLIILDAQLCNASGLEVCRQLKADPATTHIPILQTSAALTAEHTATGAADAYLIQPIEDDELQAMVGAMLRTRRAEEGERRASRKWQRTFDAMSDGVLVLDPGRCVVDCNPAMASILRMSPASIVGEPLSSVFSEALTRQLITSWPRDVTTTRWQFELSLDGRWYRLVADSAPDPHEQTVTVMVFSDITERKQLEVGYRDTALDFESSARRKDEFLAMLAHELRNPLNAIVASNALQDAIGAQDAENSRLRGIVARQSRHLARLIDDLLDVSRITRGETRMRMTVLDLRTTLERVCDSHRAVLDERNQRAHLDLPAAPVWVEGDELRLEQVCANLLSNASKYSDAGAPIQLTLDTETAADGQRHAVMTFVDRGMGIPADMLQAVFEMFVQVDRSLERTSGGLGLGLTVVKHVVEQHGGSVQARSAGQGKGTEFVVRIPCSERSLPEAASGTAPSAPSAQASETLAILLVEDNDDTRDLVCALLENRGHRVHCAADGIEGIHMALEQWPDVALIDIGLPGASGYDVARQVRAAQGSARMFLVAVTGYGSPEDQARAFEAGFDAHIVKPFDTTQLFDLLHKARGGEPGQGSSSAAFGH